MFSIMEKATPTIRQSWSDLADDAAQHRWRAYWDYDDTGIWLQAYPVVKLTACGAWIDCAARRETSTQPWEEAAPIYVWYFSDRKRFVYNDSNSAFAKQTREEAIRSLAIRLDRWARANMRTFSRIQNCAKTMQTLRPNYRALFASIKLGEE